MTHRATTEADVETYFVEQCTRRGAEVRKVSWIGRRDAPDRVVMGANLVPTTIWVELKSPRANMNTPHVRAQLREHEKMKRAGQCVVVIDSREAVDFFVHWAFHR